ncbi:MAG: hypothetical protein FJX65_08580 [Alphaproteobacteria bacterium]|nr:hypothetical protein [Alphaproteobacteria bacterium]
MDRAIGSVIACLIVVALGLAACGRGGAQSPEEIERGAAPRPVARAEPAPSRPQPEPAAVPEPMSAMAKPSVLAGLLRSDIGKQLSPADQTALTRATQTTLETVPIGTQSTWRNNDSGSAGSVTPTRTYQKPNGQYCREFTQRVEVRGRGQEANGTACRENDGSWVLVDG